MKNSKGMGVGSASIIVVFVLLCLTCFGVLSAVSARADLRLARQTADSITAYYNADGRAVDRLVRFDRLLDDVNNADDALYYAACARLIANADPTVTVNKTREITFCEKIDDRRGLYVTFEIKRPTSHNTSNVALIKWQTVAETGEYIEDGLSLWQGNGGLLK